MVRTCRRMTEKRNLLKDLEIVAKILEVYSIGVLGNALAIGMYKAHVISNERIFFSTLILIWSSVCFGAMVLGVRNMKIKFIKINSGNGKGVLRTDINENQERLKRSVLVQLGFVILSIKKILFFDGIFLCVGTLQIIINIVLIKCFKWQRQGFIEKCKVA